LEVPSALRLLLLALPIPAPPLVPDALIVPLLTVMLPQYDEMLFPPESLFV
jgi:hypothetical protein